MASAHAARNTRLLSTIVMFLSLVVSALGPAVAGRIAHAAGPAAAATIVLAPTSAVAGDAFKVTGANFKPHETVGIEPRSGRSQSAM